MGRLTCQAICNNKKPCQWKAKKGSDFCGVHKHCVKIVKVKNDDLEKENEKLKEENKELEEEVYTLLVEVVLERFTDKESVKKVLLKYLDHNDLDRNDSCYAIEWAFEEDEDESCSECEDDGSFCPSR